MVVLRHKLGEECDFLMQVQTESRAAELFGFGGRSPLLKKTPWNQDSLPTSCQYLPYQSCPRFGDEELFVLMARG